MHAGKLVFAQLMEYLPLHNFAGVARLQLVTFFCFAKRK